MCEVRITEELKSFILEKIESIGHLEVLCLLAQEPKKLWTAVDVSRELRTNESMAKGQLDTLLREGFLNQGPTGAYYYDPVELKSNAIIQQLLEAYRDRRMMVINLIYSKPTEKIRNLAEAFKLRKGDS